MRAHFILLTLLSTTPRSSPVNVLILLADNLRCHHPKTFEETHQTDHLAKKGAPNSCTRKEG